MGAARARASECPHWAAVMSSPSTPTTRPSTRSRMGAKAETNVPSSSVYGPTVTSPPEVKTSTSPAGGSSYTVPGSACPGSSSGMPSTVKTMSPARSPMR